MLFSIFLSIPTATAGETSPLRQEIQNKKNEISVLKAQGKEQLQQKRTAMEEFKKKITAWLQSNKAINTTFKESVQKAQNDFRVSVESAKDMASKQAAQTARKTAIENAKSIRDTAIRELGPKPVKP
ncbi:MAG: hypothetical protein ACKOW9_04450 [Candidatus Paceibacterota bacterium]